MITQLVNLYHIRENSNWNAKNCKEVFFGKKDAKYCCAACKSRVAIDKAAKRKKEMEPTIAMAKKGFKILRRLYYYSIGKPISMRRVISMDNLESCPAIVRTIDGYNGQWRQIGIYAYQVDKTTRQITILKIDLKK